MKNKNKLAIGSVQFGIRYGLNKSQVGRDEVDAILFYAYEKGIRYIDTAQDYGDSEKIIGEVLYNKNLNFKIITKLSSKNIKNIRDSLDTSLNRIQTNRIYGLLFHDFKTFKDNIFAIQEVEYLKSQNKVDKIGFSLYFPSELDFLLNNNIKFDILQIPFNLFDRRFEPYFEILQKLNVELHVRSVFLQGLFFVKPEKLHPHFQTIQDKLILLNNFCNKNSISIASVCLKFVDSYKAISNIVIGIDNLQNLEENINAYFKDVTKININELISNLKIDNEEIILPFKWKLN